MSAQEFKNSGNKAFSEGNFDKAVADFTKAIEAEDNYVFYSNRSGAYASMKKWSDALNDADACITRNPVWPKGYSRKGSALFGLGRLDEAKAAYDAGLKVDPSNTALLDGLKEVNEAAAAPRPGKNPFGDMFGPQMWTRLQADPKTRDFLKDPGYVAKLNALAANPQAGFASALQDPRISQSLGVIMGIDLGAMGGMGGGPGGMGGMGGGPGGRGAAKGFDAMGDDPYGVADEEDEEEEEATSKPHPAMPQAQKQPEPKKEEEVVEVDEELEREKREALALRANADAVKEKGTEAYKKKDFDAALSHYKKAHEMDDTNALYLSNISAVYFEQGRFEECAEQCREALRVGERHRLGSAHKSKIYLRLGNASAKILKWGDAVEAYRRSVLEENVPAVRQLLKNAEISKKKAEEDAYLNPELSEEAKNKGNDAFKDAKYSEAIELYSEALKRDPTNYKVYSNRAACYQKLMQWDKGLEDCERCLAKDPAFVKAYIRKGKIQHFLKQYPQALDTFRAGLQHDPNSSELLEGLQATRMAISQANRSGEVDKQRVEESMKDPAIKAILRDPVMNQILENLKTDPEAARRALNDPQVAANLERLVAAGIVRFG